MRVLGLIPARGGSKGIPRKNLAPFAGRPLLGWTCDAALGASLDDVVLSTDDPEIAAFAEDAGVRVPFLRAAALATDDTPMLAVVRDALVRLAAAGSSYDAVCLLQPTSPLRASEDIDAAVARLARGDVDSVVSVAPIPAVHHPHWAHLLDEDGLLHLAVSGEIVSRRQDLPPAWYRDGSIYVVRTSVVLDHDSLYGARCAAYVMPEPRSGGIDSPEDLARLEHKRSTR